jgi:hypothetical protein
VITIRRTGNLIDTASCFYIVLNDTATVKYEYPGATGALSFGAGESSKTISIPIDNNGAARGSYSLKVVLSDSEGNATFIGGHKELTLTILDR